MRKLKVYLDTSVISHLLQEDVPEKMADTSGKWGMIMIAKPVISPDFTIEDIHGKCLRLENMMCICIQ